MWLWPTCHGLFVSSDKKALGTTDLGYYGLKLGCVPSPARSMHVGTMQEGQSQGQSMRLEIRGTGSL